jgi:hypothetical protein
MSLQPVRLVWSPLAAFDRKNTRLRFLRVPIEANIFQGEFTSDDFGAVGDFSARDEVLWSGSIVIDIWTLVVGNGLRH